MGLKKSDLVATEPADSLLGSWHANLLHIDRKKCVLFANDKTLFNFIVPGVTRAQIRALDKLFREHLSRALASEGIADDVKERIMEEYREIGYAGTNDRKVLGSMNDLAHNYRYYIQSEGGLHDADVLDFIHRLNRVPMGAIGYQQPINALKSLYENAT